MRPPKVKKLKAWFEESDWPLSTLIGAGVVEIVRVGRWPLRRYAIKVTDQRTFAQVSLMSKGYDPPTFVPVPMEAHL